MAAATLQRETEAAARQRMEDITRTTVETLTHQQPAVHQVINTPSITPPLEAPHTLVVSLPSATNLNSLLSGHVGQEGSGVDADTSMLTTDSKATKEKSASYTKKNMKKSKDKTLSNRSSKRDSSGSVLK